MALIAVATLVGGAVLLQCALGSTDFLPRSDGNMIAVQINTPSSASLDYSRLKVEKAAALAREMPETIATNTTVNAGGGRIYVEIGSQPAAQPHRLARSPRNCAAS